MRIARRFLVSGRVQGVGFRFFVLTEAAQLGLRGWVRNLPSGHVEALAEGDEDTIEDFARRLRMGPPASRLDRVDTADATDSPDTALSLLDAGFTIR